MLIGTSCARGDNCEDVLGWAVILVSATRVLGMIESGWLSDEGQSRRWPGHV